MVTIRPGTLKDIVNVVELWEQFMGEHDCAVVKKNPKLKEYTIKRKDAKTRFKKFLTKLIETEEGYLSLAEDNGKIVGYNLARIKDEIPIFKLEKMGQIADLYVQKDYRGQRLSSKLRDSAIKWFKNNNIDVMSITVYPDNPHAHCIYKKWGFMEFKTEMRRKI